MQSRAKRQRWIACLAIFAVALLAFAPGISQYLAAVRALPFSADCPGHAMAGHAMAMPMDMSMGMPMQHGGDTAHPGATHGDACGYCTLFAHSPVTPTVLRLPFMAVVSPAEAPSPLPSIQGIGTPVRNAAPRGPPLFLLA
ncbi:DUF2946 domain-containing protein [Dyella sp.]|uniref:DUF2946 domain-containing protein n=1 Tax=Dyella sp. TaxID=1869338 RepID=UPI002ED10F2E